jgi:dipeptidyl aminopeptidase/acylaminoacyl peptidase
MLRAATTVIGLLLVACESGRRVGETEADGKGGQQSHDGGWTLEETMKVRKVDQVRISPDGRRVLFAVRVAILDGDKGEYRTRIHTANTDGSEERPLTDDAYSATGAEWSPDGRWIAFLADRSAPPAGNTIWLIPAGGGDARAIDVGGAAVANLKWSPDGSRLAFTMPAPATDAQREAAQHPNAPQVVDADTRKIQLWVIGTAAGAATGPARALTARSVGVHTHRDFGAPFDWSPDGSAIAFANNREGDWWDNWGSTEISVVNAATGERRSLASGGMAPSFSPDGRWVAYLGTTALSPVHDLSVHVVPAAGGQGTKLAATVDKWPTLIGWSANGQGVYVAEARKTFTRLTALPINGGPGVDVDPGDAVLEAFSLHNSRTMVGFTRQTLSSPMEAYVSRLDVFRPVQVSQVNASLRSHPLPRTELLQWESSVGGEIEGLLTYPIDYEAGRRYPLVVAIRSGSVAFQQAFVANPFQGESVDYYPVPELARQGYAVLLCNARGGFLPGYGPEHTRPAARPADKAYHDVMSGVDHLIRLGVADSARVGITGMSNGGLMTAWVITQTRRFKAAIVQSGITELISDATTNPWISRDLGAEPWENIQPFLKHSPLLHLGGVTTPTLILRGGSDDPVPWNQAYGMYRALQRRGIPTEMVVYPGEGHPVMAPRHLLDIGRRHVDWMGRYLR